MSIVFGVTRLAPRRQLDAATERALVDQCRRQDAEAFGRIVDAYQARVFGFARRMVGNVDEALDVTQEVFVRAYQAFDRFDGRSSLRTWLFRIAFNLCVDRSRRSQRTEQPISFDAVEFDDDAWEFPDDTWNPERLAVDAELRDVIEQGVATMSEKLRSVLLLHDAEDMAYEEIAELMKIPVGTVKSRLFLARAHLKQAVQDYMQGGLRP
jgi:RNA polymerase sigma-70 factor (ECF subfamily)